MENKEIFKQKPNVKDYDYQPYCYINALQIYIGNLEKAIINRKELLIDFLDWREKQCYETVDREWVDEYLNKYK